jgi:hypothetical protein
MNRIPPANRRAVNDRVNFSQRSQCRRCGALLLELVISGAVLGVVVAAAIPTLAWIGREREFSRQRQAAQLEVGNLMERLTALEWNELTPQRGAQTALSPSLREQIPDAKLTVAVTDDAALKARRVLVELRWEVVPGRPAPPVRLVSWVYEQPPDPKKEDE